MIIWVIVAIAIVVTIVILFFFKIKPSFLPQQISSPEAFIQKCAGYNVLEAVDKMMPQGGFVNPENYKVYQNTKIEYLCQNLGNYLSCINQHPALLNEEKEEIKNYISPKIEKCFNDLRDELGKKGENIVYGKMNLDVFLAPRRIIVEIERETTISKSGEINRFNNYKTEIESPLYELANVANEIASNEAKYCYFEYVGYMILYPEFDIRKFTMSDSTKIYTIEDKESGKKFNTAIRGCAIPAGI